MIDVPPALIGLAIGRRLRELRHDAELTQAALAILVGTHRPIVARVERGIHATTLETVKRYAAALGFESAVVLVALDPTWPTTAEVLRAA